MPFGRGMGHGIEGRAYGEPREASSWMRLDDRPFQPRFGRFPVAPGTPPARAGGRRPPLSSLAAPSPFRSRRLASRARGPRPRVPMVRGSWRATRQPGPGLHFSEHGDREQRVSGLRRLYGNDAVRPRIRQPARGAGRPTHRDPVCGGSLVAVPSTTPERSPRASRDHGVSHPPGWQDRPSRSLESRPSGPRWTNLPSHPIRARGLNGTDASPRAGLLHPRKRRRPRP